VTVVETITYAHSCLTKLEKAGRADKKSQNRPQVRFGRSPEVTYRLEGRISDDQSDALERDDV